MVRCHHTITFCLYSDTVAYLSPSTTTKMINPSTTRNLRRNNVRGIKVFINPARISRITLWTLCVRETRLKDGIFWTQLSKKQRKGGAGQLAGSHMHIRSCMSDHTPEGGSGLNEVLQGFNALVFAKRRRAISLVASVARFNILVDMTEFLSLEALYSFDIALAICHRECPLLMYNRLTTRKNLKSHRKDPPDIFLFHW